jgi:pimeloyl-ACP methyl ester carboxylesterase
MSRLSGRPTPASGSPLESLGVRSRAASDARSTRGRGVAGVGGAWVLLRGLTRESRHWGDFPLLLRAELGRPEVVLLDLPGNGVLHAEPSRTRVEEMAAFCRAELMRRSVDPPYRLLGLSLGAMVAVAWADRHPAEVAAAVLVNTSLRPHGRPAQRLRPAAWPTLLRLALLDPAPRRREEAVLRLTAGRAPADREALLRDWVAWRRECPVTHANAWRQLWAAARYRAPHAAPLDRLLLLASRGDRLVDPECSRRLAGAWQVELREHPDAGHDLPLDDGAWVARQVRLWLAAESAVVGAPQETP